MVFVYPDMKDFKTCDWQYAHSRAGETSIIISGETEEEVERLATAFKKIHQMKTEEKSAIDDDADGLFVKFMTFIRHS